MENREHIEVIFKEHYRDLCALSHYYIRDMSESEDIVQDVFVTIISKNRWDGISDFKNYLRIAVRNATFKRMEKAKRKGTVREKIGNPLAYNDLTREQEMIIMEKKLLLYREIEKLPEQCKRIFLLCCSEGLKYRETAEVMEISVNTVKTQLKKAYKYLRVSLYNIHILGMVGFFFPFI